MKLDNANNTNRDLHRIPSLYSPLFYSINFCYWVTKLLKQGFKQGRERGKKTKQKNPQPSFLSLGI